MIATVWTPCINIQWNYITWQNTVSLRCIPLSVMQRAIRRTVIILSLHVLWKITALYSEVEEARIQIFILFRKVKKKKLFCLNCRKCETQSELRWFSSSILPKLAVSVLWADCDRPLSWPWAYFELTVSVLWANRERTLSWAWAYFELTVSVLILWINFCILRFNSPVKVKFKIQRYKLTPCSTVVSEKLTVA